MANTATTGISAASELSIIAPELTAVDGVVTTTSLQIAQHFGKMHRDVLKAIKNLIAQIVGEGLRNFAQSSYLNEQGKQQPMYRITRDGFTLLAMGFTGKEALQWKLAYLGAFNKMESELVKLTHPTDRIPYSVNPTDTLSAAQAEQIRLIFKDKCDTLPKEEQAAFMTKGWSKLKSHFGCTYRQIQQREFTEAVSLASRHASEWTVVDAVPAPPLKNALHALPEPSLKNRRWLISFDHTGREVVQSLPMDAFVCTAAELPQMILQKDSPFTADEALKIASHANLRMMGEAGRKGHNVELDQLRKTVRKLHPAYLLEIAQDAWMELGQRTILKNELKETA